MAEAKVIVVTGSTGFVGARLVTRLIEMGHQVVSVSRELGFDVRVKDTLQGIGPFDHLIHLAARTFVPDSYSETEDFFFTNVVGTLNCLELCRNSMASMSFASSYVYGVPEYLPVDESHVVNAWNPYAATKIMAEDLCKLYSSEFKVCTSIFRMFNVYGPRQNRQFLIPKILEGIKERRIVLETSTPKRDFVFVDDAVEALLVPLKREMSSSEIFNVGSGRSVSVDEVVRAALKVCDICRESVEIEYLERERKSDVPNIVSDNSKLMRFGWAPETTLEQGLLLCAE